MARWLREKWLSRSFIFACWCAVVGCNESSDSGRYSPIGKQRHAPNLETTADHIVTPDTVTDVPSQTPSTAAETKDPKPGVSGTGLTTSEATPSNSEPIIPSEAKSASEVVSAITPDNVQGSVAGPPKIEILIKEKTFRTDRRSNALSVSFDDLNLEKVLNMKDVTENPEKLMPDWLKGLSGKKIRIRGFMKPTYVVEGIERFTLARDNQACCFGPNPKIDYLIDIKMKKGTAVNYIPDTRAFDVVGIFKIEPEGDAGKLFGLYVIDEAEVIDR